MSGFDLAAVREQFPALRRWQGGETVAYFDGPGGTQVPRRVVEAMVDYLEHHNANTHWAFATSRETDAALADARAAFADFVHGRPDEIVFGANMTTITFHLARALGRGFGPGDEIVVTELDHQANVAPWRALERERGVTIRLAPMDGAAGTLDTPTLLGLIGPRTKLVAVGVASNALGTISDVAAVARAAHAAGALVYVDAVHYAPHRAIDVAELGCDFLACSPYKFFGPHLGVAWGRRDLLQSLDVPKLDPAPDAAPERCETGTQNHEGIVGAAAGVEFLAGLGSGSGRRERLESAFAAIGRHESALFDRLWEGLGATKGVVRFGPPPGSPRTPTAAFRVEGVTPLAVATGLADRGVFVSHGDFYASTAVARLGEGPSGVVRAGIALYTTADEVDRLVDGVAAIARAG